MNIRSKLLSKDELKTTRKWLAYIIFTLVIFPLFTLGPALLVLMLLFIHDAERHNIQIYTYSADGISVEIKGISSDSYCTPTDIFIEREGKAVRHAKTYILEAARCGTIKYIHVKDSSIYLQTGTKSDCSSQVDGCKFYPVYTQIIEENPDDLSLGKEVLIPEAAL